MCYHRNDRERRLAAIEVGFDTFTCFDRHAHKLLYRLLPREGPGDSLAAPLATDVAAPCANSPPRKRQRAAFEGDVLPLCSIVVV